MPHVTNDIGYQATGFTTQAILTPRDVESEYRIPRSSQKRQRALGAFAPFFKVGTRIYYRRSTFERWIERQESVGHKVSQPTTGEPT